MQMRGWGLGAVACFVGACSFAPRPADTPGDAPSDTPAEVCDLPCPWGCIADPDPRCADLVPTGGGAVPADVSSTFDHLADVVLEGDPSTIDGTTGGIDGDLRSDVVWSTRTGGSQPIAVFRFKSLTVNGRLVLQGMHSIVLIADGPIAINNLVTAKGKCGNEEEAAPAGPGGFAGSLVANQGAVGLGAGGGGINTQFGGGGGGNAASGGAGGNVMTPNGGASIGDESIPILIGGGGGGAGDGGPGFGQGGGGGGAVQLISNTAITFGATGAIDAGGCGGGGGGGGGQDGGGGGGAGGTIVLEAPMVSGAGRLAVNGGGGGAGGDSSAFGSPGSLTRDRAAGGIGVDNVGGAGGAAAIAVGDNGGSGTNKDGGGGGGSIGRIRINTTSGTHALTGEISPQAGETGFSVAKPKTQ